MKDGTECQRNYRRMEATTNLTAKTKVPKEIPVTFCARAVFRKISIRGLSVVRSVLQGFVFKLRLPNPKQAVAHPAEQQNTRAHQPDHVRGAKAQMTEQRDRINSSTIKKQGRHTKSKRHLFCKMEISGKELSVEIQVFMTSEPFLSYPVSILPAIIWKYLLLNQTSSSSHLTLASLEVRG